MLRSGMDSMDGLGDSSIPPPKFFVCRAVKGHKESNTEKGP